MPGEEQFTYDAHSSDRYVLFRKAELLELQDEETTMKIKMLSPVEDEPEYEHIEVKYNCQIGYSEAQPSRLSVAFNVGDIVLAECDIYDVPQCVVGFAEGARSCADISVARITEHYSETGYYIGTLQIWCNTQTCTFTDNEDAESIHIGQHLRDYYEDSEGIWRLVDYRFARDDAKELVVLVDRFFTAYRNLPLIPNLEYKATINDSYTAIVFEINSDYKVSIRDTYTIDYGTRNCNGGCLARYPNETEDYESDVDCPGLNNKCGDEETCEGSSCAAPISSVCAVTDIHGRSATITTRCTRTCSNSCGADCCYNCVYGFNISMVFLIKGGIPRLYGTRSTTTNHAVLRTASSQTVTGYNNATGDECLGNVTRHYNTALQFKYTRGNTDECTACCSRMKERQATTITFDYAYPAGCGICRGDDGLLGPCPARSGSGTYYSYDTGFLDGGDGIHVCALKQLQTNAKEVYGEPSDYNCNTLKDISVYKNKSVGSYEYAYGVLCYERGNTWGTGVSPFPYVPRVACCCDCGSRVTPWCEMHYAKDGDWGWSAYFSYYDIFDVNVYVDSEYEYGTNYAGVVVTDILEPPTINGSKFAGFSFDGDLEGFSPAQSVPQNTSNGLSFIARHSNTHDNKFASYTTKFSGGASLERVRCAKGSYCYEEDAEDFEETWSILMSRNGAGVIVAKADDDSYYGYWYVYIHNNMPEYSPTEDDLSGNPEQGGGWADTNFKYITANLQQALLAIPLTSSPYSYRQTFRCGVTVATGGAEPNPDPPCFCLWYCEHCQKIFNCEVTPWWTKIDDTWVQCCQCPDPECGHVYCGIDDPCPALDGPDCPSGAAPED